MSDYSIRCDQAEFERGFNRVSTIVNGESSVMQERYVLVDAYDGVITMRGVRAGVMQVKHQFSADVQERDFFGLEASSFAKRVKFLAGDVLDIGRISDEEVSFRGGGVNISVKHERVWAYPHDPTIDWTVVATIRSTELARGLRLLAPMVGKDMRIITGSLRMQFTSNLLTLTAAAQTSGVTRARLPIEAEVPFEPFELFVPKNLLDVWEPIFSGQALTILQDVARNNVAFSWGGTTVSAPTMYGAWPNTDQIFTEEAATWALIPREPFFGILSLILVNNPSRDITPRATLRFSNESVRVEDAAKQKHEDAYADISIEALHGKKMRIGINARQIHGIVKNLIAKHIRVGLDQRGFIHVDVPGDDSFLHIASPIENTMGVEE